MEILWNRIWLEVLYTVRTSVLGVTCHNCSFLLLYRFAYLSIKSKLIQNIYVTHSRSLGSRNLRHSKHTLEICLLLEDYGKIPIHCVRLNSHLWFFRRELLRELFSPCNSKKWVHNPLLNFSVHTIVDQIAGVNAPIKYSVTHYST